MDGIDRSQVTLEAGQILVDSFLAEIQPRDLGHLLHGLFEFLIGHILVHGSFLPVV